MMWQTYHLSDLEIGCLTKEFYNKLNLDLQDVWAQEELQKQNKVDMETPYSSFSLDMDVDFPF